MNATKYDKGFRKLVVWREAHQLTFMVYKATNSFPKSEMYGITSQLRRASYSVETQIAEGNMMKTSDHKRSYFNRAYGSAVEVDNFVLLARDLGYLNNDLYTKLADQVARVCFLSARLVQSV